jgi:hypothetical protein
MPWAALDSTASPLKQAAGLLAFAALVDEQANALRALANYRGPVTQCPRASSAEDPCGVVWLAYGLLNDTACRASGGH